MTEREQDQIHIRLVNAKRRMDEAERALQKASDDWREAYRDSERLKERMEDDPVGEDGKT